MASVTEFIASVKVTHIHTVLVNLNLYCCFCAHLDLLVGAHLSGNAVLFRYFNVWVYSFVMSVVVMYVFLILLWSDVQVIFSG